jgi:thioredoxin reductase (NADPH)
MKKHRVLIIGSGPAGYTAAIYAARANLAPVMFTGYMQGPGGQLMTTTDVENYPGFPDGIMGPDIIEKFERQAVRFGTTLIQEDVIEVDFSIYPFRIKGTTTECLAEAVIICTGAKANRIDVPGTRESEYWQRGVTACAVCDGAMPMFRGKPLVVIGGGDTACEEALFLTKFGSKVYLVLRRDEFRASQIMIDRVKNHDKIEIIYEHVLKEVKGEDTVRSAIFEHIRSGKTITLDVRGVFFAIGHTPNTSLFKGQIELHPNQYIKVEPGTTKTSIKGVFAAGDVQDHVYRQAITAAGTGCMAAIEVEHFLRH